MLSLANWDARVNQMISTVVSAGVLCSEDVRHMREAVLSYYRKLLIAYDYQPTSMLRASTRLTFVSASDSASQAEMFGVDHGLGAIYEGHVDVHVIQGSHKTIISDAEKSAQLVCLLNTLLSSPR